eukprot:g31764.t1
MDPADRVATSVCVPKWVVRNTFWELDEDAASVEMKRCRSAGPSLGQDPNTGMPMQGFPGWPGFGGLPVGFGPPSEDGPMPGFPRGWVYTYGSLVVVSIAAILKVYALQFPNFQGLGDRALIRLGCAARLSTRLLLLFGDSVRSMQLMQVAFAVGLVGELAFWAYCLKAVPSHAQQLTAVAQAAYLVAHTFAGLLGDWLLQLTDIGLTGLMWISFASVGLSCLVALSLPPVDVGGGSIPVDRVPWFQAFSRVYRSPRRFWLSTLWWVCSYPAYQTIYGYESSLYADRFGDRTDPRSEGCGGIDV